MRHRSEMDFPLPCPRVAAPGRFRLNRSRSRRPRFGLPLSPHCNPPYPSSNEQPRSFPQQSNRFLAFFADRISNSNIPVLLADKTRPEPLSFISTQGRLLCPQHQESTARQVYSYAVLHSVTTKGEQRRKHVRRSPRKRGQRSHAIANRP